MEPRIIAGKYYLFRMGVIQKRLKSFVKEFILLGKNIFALFFFLIMQKSSFEIKTIIIYIIHLGDVTSTVLFCWMAAIMEKTKEGIFISINILFFGVIFIFVNLIL